MGDVTPERDAATGPWVREGRYLTRESLLPRGRWLAQFVHEDDAEAACAALNATLDLKDNTT